MCTWLKNTQHQSLGSGKTAGASWVLQGTGRERLCRARAQERLAAGAADAKDSAERGGSNSPQEKSGSAEPGGGAGDGDSGNGGEQGTPTAGGGGGGGNSAPAAGAAAQQQAAAAQQTQVRHPRMLPRRPGIVHQDCVTRHQRGKDLHSLANISWHAYMLECTLLMGLLSGQLEIRVVGSILG